MLLYAPFVALRCDQFHPDAAAQSVVHMQGTTLNTARKLLLYS